MRILIASLVNPNLIDGSSIWLASLTECLCASDEIRLTVPLAARLERKEVLGHLLNHPRVQFVEPGFALQELFRRRMSPRRMLDVLAELDRRERQDLFLVRGNGLQELVARRPHLAERTWAYLVEPRQFKQPSEREKLQAIAGACRRLVCQTEEARDFVRELVGTEVSVGLLPPMIPRVREESHPPMDSAGPRLGYAGKLSPAYRLEEMIRCFARIRDEFSGAEFHVMGDKFHNLPRVEGFEERVRAGLESGSGITWHQGLTREETLRRLEGMDLASSWRDESLDESLEMSTKVLEYAGLGIPVMLNDTAVHRKLLGDDYPGFVASEDDFVERFRSFFKDSDLFRRTSDNLRELARRFTFPRALDRLLPGLMEDAEISKQKAAARRQAKTILFAGHDFKFARHLLEHFEALDDFQVKVDRWKGHRRANLLKSLSLLKGVDLIFCEWCLGNAVWYARTKQPHQKLIVRLHAQELRLPFVEEIPWERVDRLVTICPRNLEILKQRFPAAADRLVLIHNTVDCEELDRPKSKGAEFNLGMVGTAPRGKDPMMALEILEILRDRDPRYSLYLKGKDPLSYPWLRKRPEEVAYYQRFNARVETSPHGANMFFTPWGDDMPEWYSRIGFILSTSDQEGSHHVVSEGMAAGCVPLIRAWPGARELYAKEWIFATQEEAVDKIQKWSSPKEFQEASRRARQEAREKFSHHGILKRYRSLFGDLLAGGE